MAKAPSRKNLSAAFHPWVFFLIFLAANILLSYTSIPIAAKWALGLAGIGLPFGLAWRWGGAFQGDVAPDSPGLFPLPPWWVWILLFGLAVFLRLAQLTTLSTWPLVDEGIAGYFATEISETGRLHFFYSYAQWPPFFVWSLGLFFKLLGPSLSSLWLFPALLSCLGLPLAYLAARAFLPASFAFLFTLVWAFSFEPLYLGRFCQGQSLEVLWQLAAFILLGRWLGAGGIGNKAAAFLGLVVGTGFYTLNHWPMMALFVSAAVGAAAWREKPRRRNPALAYFAALFLTSLPYLYFFLSTDRGTYLNSIFALHSSWKTQLSILSQYLGSLFWGVRTDRFAYKPFWGGFLNPVMGALFFLGLAALLRSPQYRWKKWILGALALFALPALLTNDLELFRWLLVFPLLFALCAVGLAHLAFRPGKGLSGWIAAAVLLAISCGLDLYHLWGPYQKVWQSATQAVILQAKSIERFRAYQILGSMERSQGPGLVFTELETTSFDQTFTTAVYPFNAARNLALAGAHSRWAALLTNINYGPFLSKRFPEGRWFPLVPEDASPPGGLVLGVIPITPENEKTLAAWRGAEESLRPVTASLFHSPFGQAPRPTLDLLEKLEPSFQSDPFLESCLAEKIFYASLSCSDYTPALKALQRALVQGYPAANLFNDLGFTWWALGNKAQAVRAFQAALASPVNHTTAAANLRALR